MCIVLMVQYVLMACLDWWMPRWKIDRAPDFDHDTYLKVGVWISISNVTEFDVFFFIFRRMGQLDSAWVGGGLSSSSRFGLMV